MPYLAFNALPRAPIGTEADNVAQREAALTFLTEKAPSTPLEASLATQHVIAYYHPAFTASRMAQGDLPTNLHHRYEGKAIALTRLASAAMHEVRRRQSLATGQAAAQRGQGRTPRPQPAPTVAQVGVPKPPPPAPRDDRLATEAGAPAQQPTQAPHTDDPAQVRAEIATAEQVRAEIAARAEAARMALAA